MKIAVVGGGPAGLYFALLAKKADPSRKITVLERNAPDDTFGWGVVFSDQTLGNLRAADEESYREITESFAHWDDIDIHFRGRTITSGGHGFSGIGRARLLEILQERAAVLGVELRFRTEVRSVEDLAALGLGDADLVVAADGVNSALRREHREHFRPDLDVRHAKYMWLGTTKLFDAFTFLFAENEHGVFQVHAYRFDDRTSAFIVECDEESWRSAGFDRMTPEESVAECERLFAPWLDRHPLLNNAPHLRSPWINFVRVSCERWHRALTSGAHLALIGDAAHTAHFSIGSGTKLALEDAIGLARILDEEPALERALERYQEERRTEALRLQNAARNSMEWFENVKRYVHLEPEQFAYSLLTRSQRVSHENLRLRDSTYLSDVERWFHSRAVVSAAAASPGLAAALPSAASVRPSAAGAATGGASATARGSGDGEGSGGDSDSLPAEESTGGAVGAAGEEPRGTGGGAVAEETRAGAARPETGHPEATERPAPPMFTPFRLREMVLHNRVVVSPMDMYSAEEGIPNDFHLVHLGSLAMGGAALVFTEMTCVSAEGRITLGCTGMYTEEQQRAWRRVVEFVRRASPAKLCMQLGHSGPKGATRLMWEGMDEPLEEGGWEVMGPSPVPYGPRNPVPREMTRADMDRVRDQFVRATALAAEAGFDMVELHCAHGYLLSSFLTPLVNRRADAYGGTLENRLRYPLEVFRAMRAAWPEARPMSVRISATDWVEGGVEADEAVEIARAFSAAGADIVHVSTGQTSREAKPVYGRMFQTPYSDQIRNEAGIPTIAVGNITEADQVNGIIAAGRADLCALGRPHLADPHWTLHAAAELGHQAQWWPVQYRAGKGQLERRVQRQQEILGTSTI